MDASVHREIFFSVLECRGHRPLVAEVLKRGAAEKSAEKRFTAADEPRQIQKPTEKSMVKSRHLGSKKAPVTVVEGEHYRRSKRSQRRSRQEKAGSRQECKLMCQIMKQSWVGGASVIRKKKLTRRLLWHPLRRLCSTSGKPGSGSPHPRSINIIRDVYCRGAARYDRRSARKGWRQICGAKLAAGFSVLKKTNCGRGVGRQRRIGFGGLRVPRVKFPAVKKMKQQTENMSPVSRSSLRCCRTKGQRQNGAELAADADSKENEPREADRLLLKSRRDLRIELEPAAGTRGRKEIEACSGCHQSPEVDLLYQNPGRIWANFKGSRPPLKIQSTRSADPQNRGANEVFKHASRVLTGLTCAARRSLKIARLLPCFQSPAQRNPSYSLCRVSEPQNVPPTQKERERLRYGNVYAANAASPTDIWLSLSGTQGWTSGKWGGMCTWGGRKLLAGVGVIWRCASDLFFPLCLLAFIALFLRGCFGGGFLDRLVSWWRRPARRISPLPFPLRVFLLHHAPSCICLLQPHRCQSLISFTANNSRHPERHIKLGFTLLIDNSRHARTLCQTWIYVANHPGGLWLQSRRQQSPQAPPPFHCISPLRACLSTKSLSMSLQPEGFPVPPKQKEREGEGLRLRERVRTSSSSIFGFNLHMQHSGTQGWTSDTCAWDSISLLACVGPGVIGADERLFGIHADGPTRPPHTRAFARKRAFSGWGCDLRRGYLRPRQRDLEVDQQKLWASFRRAEPDAEIEVRERDSRGDEE
ncbi:hypothetical protein C8F04DRAFT_1345307 [Mycena alexandri]|uniref:Uncharacterized protein n=1 Tax=Mycena alexandri TaxID=1745969 RepID=A0AAD6WK63_9AGAR|nr:hypothetical protein C8F04DRAFT_1345307 [Mycena alexandri]